MSVEVINIDTKNTYLIEANKTGENLILCPVCSHTRKKKTDKCFSYNYKKDAGYCHHCGVTLIKKKEFEAILKTEFKRPPINTLKTFSKKVIDYFNTRQISEDTLLKAKVSEGNEWMPQFNKVVQTIQFNYYKYNELINIKSRGANKSFKLFKDAELIPYNIDCTNKSDYHIKNEIIIVEGEIDCLTIIECGISNVISVPNGAGNGKINLDYLDSVISLFNDDTTFVLALDNDVKGNNLKTAIAQRLGIENCFVVTFKDCKDANECLVKYGKLEVLECLNNKIEFPIQGIFDAFKLENEILNYYENGLPDVEGTGIKSFDKLLKFHEGYLTTITGIPSHGKSEFLDFLLCKLNLNQKWKFGIFSPENHPTQLHVSKFAEKIIGKTFSGYNKMNRLELNQFIKYHSKNFYFIKPEKDYDLESILNHVKILIRKYGISAFVIDAWNKIEHQYSKNETQYISEQLEKLNRFCELYNVHCFLVAHPTKMLKKKNSEFYEIPTLYNISGSSNFYNKSANGISVYRDFEKNLVDIYVQKVKFKHWGKIGFTSFSWDYMTGRYFQDKVDYSNWILPNKQQDMGLEDNFNINYEAIQNTSFLSDEPF